MKRKAEKHQTAAPVSAIAARRARQQQGLATVPSDQPPRAESVGERPSKKPRRSLEDDAVAEKTLEEDSGRRQSKRQAAVKARKATERTNKDDPSPKTRARKLVATESPSAGGSDEQDAIAEENSDIGAVSTQGGDEGYESPADTPAQAVEFPLSKTRLNKHNIVYSDEHRLCVRIKEKMSLVLIGQYDLWVKRGVVSLMGAKLHPSPHMYRVYAPSTHSLPVIKCVSGVDGEAEVEFQSCHSGIYRLRHLSPLYQRTWNSKNTPSDKLSLKGAPDGTRRTFSVLNTSADDQLKRHLRPLHLEKQWSAAIKTLSQRGGRLQALICGPKASGKSTFSRYLLNHLLSPAPQTESNYCNTDGVAFLDLDPGQPEFSPMGQIYLAHLRSPVFGPPFTHPTLDNASNGKILRAHHIGATSPKDDPNHYVLAATDLMNSYRALLASYPQCPLIINYPGWIFGLGLEVAMWLVRSLGLSDVVYMSEKGPTEVVEPLGQAAREARIPLIILPSQPTDFVSRSSAQLRSMQMQSYFHMSHPREVSNPLWLEQPISRTRPFHVHYAGPKQGIQGIMVMGSQMGPDLLCEILEGAIVGVVAVESPNAIADAPRREHGIFHSTKGDSGDSDVEMDSAPKTNRTGIPSIESSITRTTKENLPYLFVGAGTCSPLDPKASRSLGLALVRSINTSSHQLELVTPIPGSKIREALEQGNQIILVRGQLDNPNWAISEDYHASRTAEKRYRASIEKSRKVQETDDNGNSVSAGDREPAQARTLFKLQDRIQRAKNVPWMTVIESSSRRHQETVQREKSLWKLRKKAYPDSESEADY